MTTTRRELDAPLADLFHRRATHWARTAARALREQNPLESLDSQGNRRHVATVLDKVLKRQVTVEGVDYTVALDPEGLRLTGKGKRRPEVELRWRDLVSGEAAMAVALNASLTARPAAVGSQAEPSPDRTNEHTPRKPKS